MDKPTGQAKGFVGPKDGQKGGNIAEREMAHCRKRPGRRLGLEGFLY
jgi:hypothetical protein